VEVDGEGDHVHLLVHYPPTVYLQELVNSLKGYGNNIQLDFHFKNRFFTRI
jgi:putative transposase